MSTVSDKDIFIGVCPMGHEVNEYSGGGGHFERQACSHCGMNYAFFCPGRHGRDSERWYHPSDYKAKYHGCGEAIPWNVAMTGHEGEKPVEWTSQLVGQDSSQLPPKYENDWDQIRKVAADEIWKMRFAKMRRARPTSPGDVSRARDLTPEQRQDLIVPPNGRLPAESVRVPETQEPRKTMFDTGDSSGPSWNEAKKTTWDQLESGQVVKVDRPAPPLWQRVLKGWWDLLFGSLQNAIGGFMLIVALIVLAVYFGVKVVQPQ